MGTEEIQGMSKARRLLLLYCSFFRITALVVGGGLAMLPVIEEIFVVKHKLLTRDELLDMTALTQTVPGIIAINVSTFVGNKKAGIPGGIIASLGFLTMPITIILIIAAFLTNFADIPAVQHAFAGIRVCVCVLILQAVLRLWNKAIVDKKTLGLYILILFLTVFSKQLPISIPTAAFVICAGLFGVLSGGKAAGQAPAAKQAGDSHTAPDNHPEQRKEEQS
jgi:chromate transporter